MSGIVEWVKNYCMVFLLLTALASAAVKKEYRKYIQLFVEIILVITLLDPLFHALGKSGDLFEKTSYDSFWQGLEGLKMDQGKLDFLNDAAYLSYYEKAIESDVKLLAENSGYVALDVAVVLNEEYGIESMELEVAKEGEETIVIGRIGEGEEDAQAAAFREKVAAYYQIDKERVFVLD